MANTITLIPDRVKLPFHFDVEKLQAAVAKLQLNGFIYYNVCTLRGPAHFIDPTRPAPPPAEDYADGSWTDWLDTADLKSSPYLQEVLEVFRANTTVNLVRLLRLAPHAVVKEHTDPTLGLEIERSMIRLTIPIIKPADMTFFLNGEPVAMEPGECWYLCLTDPHKIINNSAEERINLTIDVIPNAWMRAQIEAAALEQAQ